MTTFLFPVIIFVVVVIRVAPSAAPQDVEAAVESARVVRLSWRPPPPFNRNGELRLYTVRYRRRGSGDEDMEEEVDEEEKVVTTMDTELRLASLRPFSVYSFRVSASTRVGEGPYTSPPVLATTEESSMFRVRSLVRLS